MATIRFFDTYAGAFTVAGSDSSVDLSLNFIPIADGTVSALAFHRGDTTSGHKPTHLLLYDGVDGSVLADITSLTDSVAVGWQETTLGTPVTVYANRLYKVAARWTGGYFTSSPSPYAEPTPPYGLTWGATKRCYHYGGTVVSGATCDSSGWYALDIAIDVGTSGAPPATSADVLSTLEAWWDSSSTINGFSNLGVDYALSEFADYLQWSINNAKTVIGYLPTSGARTVLESLTDLEQWLLNLFGGSSGTPTVNLQDDPTGTMQTSGNALTDLYTALTDQITTVQASVSAPLAPFGATGWAMTDEQDWTDALDYAEPADLYVVDVYTYADTLDVSTYAGVDVIYRLGWWAPINAGYLEDRRYFDFTSNHLINGGRRMAGCWLALPRGGTGHVQAWTYTP